MISKYFVDNIFKRAWAQVFGTQISKIALLYE